jgi:hypothetical protein
MKSMAVPDGAGPVSTVEFETRATFPDAALRFMPPGVSPAGDVVAPPFPEAPLIR